MKRKPCKIVSSMTENKVIGSNNQLVCRDSRDLKFFKELTALNTVVMGRKTYESMGRVLPFRYNIIVSRTLKSVKGAKVISSFDEIDSIYHQGELYVIGGESIFRQALARATDIYLSVFHTTVQGDAVFPDFESQFDLKSELAYYKEFDIRHYQKKA